MTRFALFFALLAPTVGLAHAPLLVETPDVEGISDAYDPDGLHCGELEPGDAEPFAQGDDREAVVPVCGEAPRGVGEGVYSDEGFALASW